MSDLKDLKTLFPSSNTSDLDATIDKKYIINTLLKNSTMEGWKWMLDAYESEDIADVLKSSKTLTPRETYFWSYFLDIPQNEILCLNKDLQTTPRTSWAY